MSIPYHFDTPVPKYFRENGYFLPSNKLRIKNLIFIQWAFSRCQTKTHKILHDGKEITLAPFEFIFGRLACSEECGLTEDEVRYQIREYKNSNLLIETENSVKSRYSCFRWNVDAFPSCLSKSAPAESPAEYAPSIHHKGKIKKNPPAESPANSPAESPQIRHRPKKIDIDLENRPIHSSKLNGFHKDFGVAQGFAHQIVTITLNSIQQEDLDISNPKAYLTACFKNTQASYDLAKSLDGKKSKTCSVCCGPTYLEFAKVGNCAPVVLSFTEKDFLQKAEKVAKECGILR